MTLKSANAAKTMKEKRPTTQQNAWKQGAGSAGDDDDANPWRR